MSSVLNARKMFAMNCLLVSVLRTMSFGSMAAFAWLSYGDHAEADKLSDAPDTQDFYEKALIVLFDFPDFSAVSAYVLLLVMWCESFVQVPSFQSRIAACC